eukprot:CAMPEP_0195538984 /NCGR_PEP_ID=MMETSP0794_2-20130614/49816_1 /TAXON_ID=515487 /ORGANISM="Stephanopyxis turris, Strain CCMP 815" /LENGTH=502 /DNA_ID=CAMNT_0040672999 /DNA_START=1257 /DNA_END=2765 /DNA_ORIENTATION=-
MQPVTLPRFMSAGSATNTTNANPPNGEAAQNWTSTVFQQNGLTEGGDQLDFDLLAEYLLDEGTNLSGMGTQIPGAGAKYTTAATSTAATADSEQYVAAVTSHADPLADAHAQLAAGATTYTGSTPDIASDLAQVQQMIAAHAARASVVAQAPAPLSHPSMPSYQNQAAPPTSAVVNAAPGPYPSMVSHQHSAPAPNAPIAVTAPDLSGNKRPLHSIPLDATGQRRQKTEAQINRRRERNRILARRTRLRKKFFFESLQKEVTDLQRENNALKEIVKSKLEPPQASKILEDCKIELPSIVSESCGDANELDRQDFSLIKSLQSSQQCFIITDPSLQDNPIVYASEGFLTMTGYSRDEVLGRNCRFLQGTETMPSKVETIKKALEVGEDVSVCLINYTADGTAFWNQLFIAALRDANNNIVNFVGVLVKVAAPGPEDPEAEKQLPGQENSTQEGCNADDVADDNNDNPEVVSSAVTAESASAAEGTVAAITDDIGAAVAAAPKF